MFRESSHWRNRHESTHCPHNAPLASNQTPATYLHMINITATLLTIAFGLFGFLAPRYTASALDLEPTKSNMGLSEMRASVGGLFVFMGLAAFWLDHPIAYAMIGFAFVGAALGRVVSLIFDKPPLAKVLVFGGIEAALAIAFLGVNLS